MESEKNGINDLIYKVEIETDTENKCVDTKGERGSRMNWELGIDIYTPLILCIKLVILVIYKAMVTHSSTLCLENPMDGGAWWAAVHGVTESRTQLSDFTFIFHFHALEKEMAAHPSVLAWRIPGQGSLVGCRLWGGTESDTTERLHFHFSLPCIGEGNGSPPQCSCLENPRDGGAWWAAVYGVAQSRTRLKRLGGGGSSSSSYI